MQTLLFHVKGMHCNSCKLLLEKSLTSLENIKTVNANVQKNIITIGYDKSPNIDDIKNIIYECGYEVSETPVSQLWFSKDRKDYVIMACSLLGFTLLYIILSKTNLGFFDITTQGKPSLSLVLLIGLTAGFSSCMAVLGGLVLAISSKRNKANKEQSFGKKLIPHFWFNAGRVIGFAVLGGLLGLFGSFINVSPLVMAIMTLIVGVVMILLGINLSHISPRLSSLAISLPTGKFFAKEETNLLESKPNGIRKYFGAFMGGVTTFLLPCGFTFAMQLYAISTGSFWMGMMIMSTFALGTLPGLIGIGSLTSIFKGKIAQTIYKIIGVLVVLLGVYNISHSYSIVQHSFTKDTSTYIDNQAQEIYMTYTSAGLKPNIITLQAGKSYKIIIDVHTDVYGCMSTIYLPGLDENIQTIKNGSKITFFVSSNTSGEYEFTCAMGLPHKAKIIIK